MQGGKEASQTEEGADLTSQEEAVVVVEAEAEEEEAAAGVEKEEQLTGMKMRMTSALILDHLLPTGIDTFWLFLYCHYTVVWRCKVLKG